MRPACPRCLRPLRTCLCRWAVPTDNRLPLLVLQHPDEAHQAKGSLRLLALSLARCRVVVGTAFDADALAGWLACPGGSLLLFPAEGGGVNSGVNGGKDGGVEVGAASGPPGGPTALPSPGQLVLLDGTWRQAGQLLRAHPPLQALPRWALPSPPPSRYTIRRAPRAAQRATLEAACLALGLLEGRPVHYAALLGAFSDWVAAMAALAATPEPV